MVVKALLSIPAVDEVLVVADGSADRTAEEASAAGVPRRGGAGGDGPPCDRQGAGSLPAQGAPGAGHPAGRPAPGSGTPMSRPFALILIGVVGFLYARADAGGRIRGGRVIRVPN